MKNKRTLWIVFISVLVLALVVYGFWPKPIPVEVALVEKGPMAVTIEEEGATRVRDRYVVSSPVNGYARRIVLDVGDTVSQGQTLAVIEPSRSSSLDPRSTEQARARLAAARANLQRAEAERMASSAALKLAEAEFSRLRKLRESGFATSRQLDAAQAELQRSQAADRSVRFAIDVARHEVRDAEALLSQGVRSGGSERLIVKAPVGGRVLKIHRKSEGPVNPGQSLVEIGDPAQLEVEVDVLSKDAVRIRPGSKVILTRWGGSVDLEGRVRRVEPAGFTKISALGVEEQRVWVIVDLMAPKATMGQLGDGYRVEAQFIVWAASDVLHIPSSALFRDGEGWSVFVASEGRAERRKVQVGQRSGLRAQILGGLTRGAEVIVHPPSEANDGTRIDRLSIR